MEYTRAKLEFEECATSAPRPIGQAHRRARSPRWDAVLRSMRNSKLRNTAVFLGLGLALALGLQAILLRGLGRYSGGNVGILNKVMRGEVHASLVISGSSRAAYHYDPRIIGGETGLSSFNLGRDGTKLHEQLDLLQRYLRRNPKPACVVQNLDVMSLQGNEDVTDPKQYLSWLSDDEIYQPLRKQKRHFLVYRWLPIVGLAREGGMSAAVEGWLLPHAAEHDALRGYCPQDLTWNQDFDRFKALHPSGLKLGIDARKEALLGQLIELCQTNQIKIVLVYSPDYLESRAFFQDRDEVLQDFKRIAEHYHVPLWDFSGELMCADRKFFYNSQHLNRSGASAFSKTLGERLRTELAGLADISGQRAAIGAGQ